MLTVILVIAVTSAALIAGAAWGLWGHMSDGTEGFLVALAGGALIVSVVAELIEPAARSAPLAAVAGAVILGAAVFSAADWWIDERWGGTGGWGLLAAITLDGIPENMALGVALIDAGALEVAALAGSILLSNLPEAAGGARGMRDGQGHGGTKVFWIWTATAGLLAAAALLGNVALAGAGEAPLALIGCLAAGAVVASLSTEVYPKAFREDRQWSGIAVALGVVLGFGLHSLAG